MNPYSEREILINQIAELEKELKRYKSEPRNWAMEQIRIIKDAQSKAVSIELVLQAGELLLKYFEHL